MKGKDGDILSIIAIIFVLYFSIGILHSLMYSSPNYVCRHMARDLEDMFEYLYIDTKIEVGWNKNYTVGHMWIKVFGIQLDSVTLFPYNPDWFGYVHTREFESYEDYEDSRRIWIDEVLLWKKD